MLRFTFASLLLISVSQIMAQAHAPTPIEALIRCSLPGGDVMWTVYARFVAAGDLTHKDEVNAMGPKIGECLDAKLPDALAYAGDVTDLRAAIKDFYVKESAAYPNRLSIAGEGERAYDRRVESDNQIVDPARVRLRMEAKLAHK